MNRSGKWAKPIRALMALILFLATAYPTVLWLEAEKEIRILCSMLPAGTVQAEVMRTLDTGNLLRYRPEARDRADLGSLPGNPQGSGTVGSTVLLVESPWALGTSACRLAMERGVVVANSSDSTFRLATVGVWLAVVGFILLIVHQILLALGTPIGHLAWGGRHRVLPTSLRLASALSAGLLAVGSLAVLQKAGLVAVLPWTGLAETLPWVLMVVFFLSLLANALSERPWERRLGMLLALILSLACLVVGLG